MTDGFLGNIPPHELLKQIYEYDRHTYNTFQDLGNSHEYPRLDLPYKVYFIALHEAHLPKYDIFRRAGWTEDKIVNKLANEIYVPLVYLVKEGRGWTIHTDLSEEEWKRFDQIMEIRFIKSLEADSSTRTYTQKQKDKLVEDWKNELKKRRSPSEFNLEEAKKQLRPFRQV